MKTVNRFESNLLRILYSVFGNVPLSQSLPLIIGRFSGGRPKCLSRTCVDLIEQALKKGCIVQLARAGGWRKEAFLCEGQICNERLWSRHNTCELGLAFSPLTLEFLIWVTAVATEGTRASWKPSFDLQPKTGDLLLLFLFFRSVRHTKTGRRLANHPHFARNGLIRLAFPEHFAEFPVQQEPDFEQWVSGTGAAILEALQWEIVNFWLEVESGKQRITSRQQMRQLGSSQSATLHAFIQVADGAGRSDLYRFLIELTSQLFQSNPDASFWTRSLNVKDSRLADRILDYRAAVTIPDSVSHLNDVNQRFHATSYFDPEYQESQLWKTNWERFQGDRIVSHAELIMRELSP